MGPIRRREAIKISGACRTRIAHATKLWQIVAAKPRWADLTVKLFVMVYQATPVTRHCMSESSQVCGLLEKASGQSASELIECN